MQGEQDVADFEKRIAAVEQQRDETESRAADMEKRIAAAEQQRDETESRAADMEKRLSAAAQQVFPYRPPGHVQHCVM